MTQNCIFSPQIHTNIFRVQFILFRASKIKFLLAPSQIYLPQRKRAGLNVICCVSTWCDREEPNMQIYVKMPLTSGRAPQHNAMNIMTSTFCINVGKSYNLVKVSLLNILHKYSTWMLPDSLVSLFVCCIYLELLTQQTNLPLSLPLYSYSTWKYW